MSLFQNMIKAHVLEVTPDYAGSGSCFASWIAGFFSGVSITILLLMLAH